MFESIFMCVCMCGTPKHTDMHTHTYTKTHTHALCLTLQSGGSLVGAGEPSLPLSGGACPRCSSHTCHVSGGSDAATLLFVRWAQRHTRAESRGRQKKGGRGVEREEKRRREQGRRKAEKQAWDEVEGEIKAEEFLTLAVMRDTEDDAEGDILTLLTADQLFTATKTPWEGFRVGPNPRSITVSLFKRPRLTVTPCNSDSHSRPFLSCCDSERAESQIVVLAATFRRCLEPSLKEIEKVLE